MVDSNYYDSWKLSYPDHWDLDIECQICNNDLDDDGYCQKCEVYNEI